MLKTLAAALLVAFVGAALTASTASANDHDKVFDVLDPTISIYKTATDETDEAQMAEAVSADEGIHAIARNLIISDDPIDVCVDGSLRSQAVKAVKVWNDGLGRDVFRIAPTGTSCTTTGTAYGYDSIRITSDEGDLCRILEDDDSGDPSHGVRGCFAPTHVSNGQYVTYKGIGQIRINTIEWELLNNSPQAEEDRVALLAHELGHTLGLAHPFELYARTTDTNGLLPFTDDDGNVLCADQAEAWLEAVDANPRITLDAYHDAAFDAIATNSQSITGALLNWNTACSGDTTGTLGDRRWTNGQVSLGTWEKEAYKAAYTPQAPDGVRVGNSPDLTGNDRVRWDPSEVTVEKDFQVQVYVRYKNGSYGWENVSGGRSTPNGESVSFTRPSDTSQYSIVTRDATRTRGGSRVTYRVVSTTDAVDFDQTTDEYDPFPESISVGVEFSTPKLRVEIQFVCVEWGWWLRWRNTVSNTVGQVRVPGGYSSYSSAFFVYSSSRQLIGSGGGIAPPFPILGGGVFCARSAQFEVVVGSSSASQASESAEVRTESESVAVSTIEQKVQAALDALTTCINTATDGAGKSACTTAFATAVGNNEGGEAGTTD